MENQEFSVGQRTWMTNLNEWALVLGYRWDDAENLIYSVISEEKEPLGKNACFKAI